MILVGDLTTGDLLLTAEQVAARADISARTLHAYLHDHRAERAPQPDGHVGRTPVWLSATVEQWLRTRQRQRPHHITP